MFTKRINSDIGLLMNSAKTNDFRRHP